MLSLRRIGLASLQILRRLSMTALLCVVLTVVLLAALKHLADRDLPSRHALAFKISGLETPGDGAPEISAA